jgi:hypothetical protein
MNCRRLICGGLALGVMAVGSGAASARMFSLSATNFRARWSSMAFSEGPTGIRVSCAVTIEGSYHSRTIQKVAGTLIGYVTRAVLNGNTCTGGRATVLAETLPWHIAYDSFIGTLPNITEIRIRMIGESYRIEPSAGFTCLMRTTTATPGLFLLLLQGFRWPSFRLVEREIEVTGFCPSGRITMEGAGTQEQLGSTTILSVTLI